ncbi:MAG TPA: outer membrane lipoprotein chaperone LolA [Candidatus Binatia bacterium]|nr:outer membrane lipoprotein chaperone LolA [Candidatus Binatia bacterium]
MLLFVIALLLGAGAPLRAASDPLKDALRRLQERYEATRTLAAEFTQTVESPTLSAPLVSHGTVAFEKPNRMRWDYAPPDAQTIVGDGDSLWIYQAEEKQVIKAPLGEAFRASTPVTFLAGLGRVERDFDASLVKDGGSAWVLQLVPKKDAGIGTLFLTVRKADASVEEAKITDPLGTTTRIRFSNEKRNAPLDRGLFQFTPPPGVDVVRPPTY